MTSKSKGGERRRGIQSVEIGLRVLEVVAKAREPSNLSTIARDSELSTSQAHRYLSSLMASGMIKQDGRAGLYDLDVGAIRLGLAALSRLDSFALADDVCRSLTAKVGRTCMLSVWGDMGPVVVRWFDGNPPVVTSLAVGSILPLVTSATGKVFLAFDTASGAQDLARKEAKAVGMRLSEVEEIKKATRSEMLASVKGDLVPGLRADAGPVFDLQGRLCFALTLIANGRFDESDDPSARLQLMESCRELTEALGGDWASSRG